MAKTLYNNTVNVGAYSSSGTLYSDYYSMSLNVVENDYNINTNRSPIVLTAKFRNNKNWQAWSGYSESNCPKFTLTLYDNKTETTRTYNYYLTALNAKQEVTIFEKTLDLEHNSDGNLKINVTLSVERQSQVYYFPLNTQMNTNSLTCTTIPRATKAVDVNCEVESQKIIALQPYVATFTHSIKVVFGSISKYINASGNLQDSEVKLTNPTITFNVPTSFYGQFTGQNQSQNNGIEVRTYNGNTQIGNTQYGKLTVSCNETKCRPSISGTVTDSNKKTSDLTGNPNKLVKYYSTAYLNLTLNPTSTSGDSNTTITSRSVDGNTFSGTTYSIANATKSSFNVTLTNSRGYSNTVTVSASGGLVDYFKPKAIVEFSRTSQTADTVQVKYSVDIFNGSFGDETNKVTVKAQVYQNDAWTDINTLNTDSTSDIATTTVTLSGSYVYTSNFNFRLIATDLLDTTYVAQLVTAGVPNFSHGKGWFQHHTSVYLQDNSLLDTSPMNRQFNGTTSWKNLPDNGMYSVSNNVSDTPPSSMASLYGMLRVTNRYETPSSSARMAEYYDANGDVFTNMIWNGTERGWKKLVNSDGWNVININNTSGSSATTYTFNITRNGAFLIIGSGGFNYRSFNWDSSTGKFYFGNSTTISGSTFTATINGSGFSGSSITVTIPPWNYAKIIII